MIMVWTISDGSVVKNILPFLIVIPCFFWMAIPMIMSAVGSMMKQQQQQSQEKGMAGLGGSDQGVTSFGQKPIMGTSPMLLQQQNQMMQRPPPMPQQQYMPGFLSRLLSMR